MDGLLPCSQRVAHMRANCTNEGEGNIDYVAFVAFYSIAHDRKLRKVPREFFKLYSTCFFYEIFFSGVYQVASYLNAYFKSNIHVTKVTTLHNDNNIWERLKARIGVEVGVDL
jgi:hypothetical protein